MKKIFLIVVWGVWILPSVAQVPNPAVFGQTITRHELSEALQILAAADMEGREAGSPGQKKAAAYISDQFHKMGLKPVVSDSGGGKSYYQPLVLSRSKILTARVRRNSQKLTHLKEMICLNGNTYGNEVKVPLVFVQKGNPEDYTGLDVKGKAVLMVDYAEDAIEKKEYALEQGAVAFFAVTTRTASQFNRQMKLFSFYLSRPKVELKESGKPFPTFMISPEYAAVLLNVAEGEFQTLSRGHSSEVQYKVEVEETFLSTENVVGIVEGTDKKEEVIVITAHYDHIGKQGEKIYYGADDNASGTVALLEIAEAFAEAAKQGVRPRRSVLFIALTAEEKGLLGSDYYTQNPLFPLEKTVTNLNMDMVGHLDQNHTQNPRFVSVVGSDWLSSELHEIHETANQKYVQLELDYRFNSPTHPEMFYYRSDQYNFAKFGIPVIFYTSADHEDYHKPTDTVDKIKFERIEGVAQLIFYTAWEIANREKRLKVDKTPPH
ncbi:MAG: M28 family peptidase [Bacteroidia bacterium]|nr:M28 family peptidase [Bacteroidia bacterium]